jgi:predicted dinucleotide-utilizing enzyme
MWNSGVVRRPNFRDVPQQEREARLKLAKETTATIIDATVAAVEVVEASSNSGVDATTTNELSQEFQRIVLGESNCQDFDFSDDEEYSTEAGVYRAMCREGLIEE